MRFLIYATGIGLSAAVAVWVLGASPAELFIRDGEALSSCRMGPNRQAVKNPLTSIATATHAWTLHWRDAATKSGWGRLIDGWQHWVRWSIRRRAGVLTRPQKMNFNAN